MFVIMDCLRRERGNIQENEMIASKGGRGDRVGDEKSYGYHYVC